MGWAQVRRAAAVSRSPDSPCESLWMVFRYRWSSLMFKFSGHVISCLMIFCVLAKITLDALLPYHLQIWNPLTARKNVPLTHSYLRVLLPIIKPFYRRPTELYVRINVLLIRRFILTYFTNLILIVGCILRFTSWTLHHKKHINIR